MPIWMNTPTLQELFNWTKAHKVTVKMRKATWQSFVIPETSAVSLSYGDPPQIDQGPSPCLKASTPQTKDQMPIDRARDPPFDFEGDRSRM